MHPARRLWSAIEPLHSRVYFAPEPAAAAKALGLRGWWMGYFAGRAAPLGPVGAEPVTAMFFGFAPGMVARALPDAWSYADPAAVLDTRLAAVGSVLPAGDGDRMGELADLLWRAVEGCRFDGRPLGAAWSAVPRPDEAAQAVWLAATILREHRGDGHVAAAVASGLSGLENTITFVASGAIARDTIQPNRGWTDEEWDEAAQRLIDNGIVDPSGPLTADGEALRDSIERATDGLANGPVEQLGPSALERVVELATPLSRELIDGGRVPVPNPIGVPRP
jgi:hypothetical protein